MSRNMNNQVLNRNQHYRWRWKNARSISKFKRTTTEESSMSFSLIGWNLYFFCLSGLVLVLLLAVDESDFCFRIIFSYSWQNGLTWIFVDPSSNFPPFCLKILRAACLSSENLSNCSESECLWVTFSFRARSSWNNHSVFCSFDLFPSPILSQRVSDWRKLILIQKD